MKVKYLILGAGPAGLTFAHALLERGEQDFLVLEREDEAGGLCRSVHVDGSELDIGGGHFLDVRRPEVVDFLFRFMPKEEWNLFDRDSRIEIHKTYINHPFEANIWQLPKYLQQMYLKSVKEAGCNNNVPQPFGFTDWIRWKLGDAIADNYMLPYNRKMYGETLDELGTYWLEKLPNVSYEETLLSCKEHKAYGTQPGHAQFYYPKKYGIGEVFRRMACELGDRIWYRVPVCKLNVDTRTVNDVFEAEYIITTIPWTSVDVIEGMPKELLSEISRLKHTGIYVDYFKKKLDTGAQWIYCPEETKVYHRILVRHNFLEGAEGYWTETRADRREKLGLDSEYSYKNEYAYPLNTMGKNEAVARILEFCAQSSIYGLGRWGEWQHFNADAVISRSLELAKKI